MRFGDGGGIAPGMVATDTLNPADAPRFRTAITEALFCGKMHRLENVIVKSEEVVDFIIHPMSHNMTMVFSYNQRPALTPMEEQTIRLQIAGLAVKEIARIQAVSESTVKSRLSDLRSKFNAKTNVQMVSRAADLLDQR